MSFETYSEYHNDAGNATNTGLHPSATKALIAFGMFGGTMVFASIPVFLSNRTHNKQSVIQRALTAMSCLGGGIFLATCFLHLMPEGAEKMEDALKDSGVEIDLPLPFVVILCGFLLVLLLEELVQFWTGTGHGHSHGLPPAEVHDTHETSTRTNGHFDESRSLIHEDPGSHSAFRAVVMVFALSLHSIFEGVAIGLQDTTAEVLELFGAIVVHKLVIAVTLATSLLNSTTQFSQTVILCCLAVFSAMSPIGILIAIGLNSAPAMINGVMQCVAAGTFVYITFFEILPHELNSKSKEFPRWLKIALLLMGIVLMIVIRLIFPDKD